MKTRTLKALHNRATMAASALVAALVACILCYLMAVEKGALPSVTKSLIQKPAQSVVSNPPPAKVVTVAAVPRSTAAPLPASPRPPVTSSDAPKHRAKAAGDQVQKQDTVSTEAPTPTNALGPVRGPDKMIMVTPPTADDERLARKWLEEATNRPSIRVRYDPHEVLRLVELRRGLLVVGSGDTNNQREFYLASKLNTAPLFDRLTKAILYRFSTYSLALNSSPAFQPLTTSLPAYFPDTNYEFAFVPDQPLAVEIFSQIASASRSLPIESGGKLSIIFEGQLRLNGQKPDFQLLEVRSGMARHLIGTP
jgi:hypothetical protein